MPDRCITLSTVDTSSIIMQCGSVECCQARAVDCILHVQDVADDAWCYDEAESKPQHPCRNIQHHSDIKVHTAS